MIRRGLLVPMLLRFAGRARAECWDYAVDDEVLGVAPDGAFVLRRSSYARRAAVTAPSSSSV
jgi:hypothetical protein